MSNTIDERYRMVPPQTRTSDTAPILERVDATDVVECDSSTAMERELHRRIAEEDRHEVFHQTGNLVGGLIEGLTGVVGHQEPGFEEWYAAGHLTGAALGLYGDANTIGTGLGAAAAGVTACGTGVLCTAGAPATALGVGMVGAGTVAALELHGPELLNGLGQVEKWHHIATNKNSISPVRGGPWTPRFEKLFDRAGIGMKDALNLVWVPGHYGPHPELYHRAVYDRLMMATQGLHGSAYKGAFVDELRALAIDIADPLSDLNQLVAPGGSS